MNVIEITDTLRYVVDSSIGDVILINNDSRVRFNATEWEALKHHIIEQDNQRAQHRRSLRGLIRSRNGHESV